MPATQTYYYRYAGNVGCNRSYRDPHAFSTEVIISGGLFAKFRVKSGIINPGVSHEL